MELELSNQFALMFKIVQGPALPVYPQAIPAELKVRVLYNHAIHVPTLTYACMHARPVIALLSLDLDIVLLAARC